jgi:hypothetical protein
LAFGNNAGPRHDFWRAFESVGKASEQEVDLFCFNQVRNNTL